MHAIIERERTALRVQLGRAVLVAEAECQRQVLPHFPFVLEICADVVGPDVRRSLRELQELIRQSHQEIGTVILGETSAAVAVEEKLAINVEIVDRVVLVRSVVESGFKTVAALSPNEVVAPDVRVIDEPGGPLRAEARTHAAVESKKGRAGRLIGSDADPQVLGLRKFNSRNRLDASVALRREPEFIHGPRGDRFCVSDAPEIVIHEAIVRIARDIGKLKWGDCRIPAGSERDR